MRTTKRGGWRIRCDGFCRDVCARTTYPVESTSIGRLMQRKDGKSPHSAEGFSLLEMMMVVTLISEGARVSGTLFTDGWVSKAVAQFGLENTVRAPWRPGKGT